MRKPAVILFLCICGIAYAQKIPDLNDLIDFGVFEYMVTNNLENADSNRLNTLGLKAYKDGDLLRAVKLWYCAASVEDATAWAHYNLSCVLSLFASEYGRDPADIIYMLEYGDPDVDMLFSYIDEIFYHLKTAVFLEPKIHQRMQEDPDLNLIHNMKEFGFMALYPENNPGELLNIYIDNPEKCTITGKLEIEYDEMGYIQNFWLIIGDQYFYDESDFSA